MSLVVFCLSWTNIVLTALGEAVMYTSAQIFERAIEADELATISMKAMDTDLAHRYATARNTYLRDAALLERWERGEELTILENMIIGGYK